MSVQSSPGKAGGVHRDALRSPHDRWRGRAEQQGGSMSILFVLLTFLLILTVMYLRRPQDAVNTLQAAPAKKAPSPLVGKQAGFEIPEGYCFHPGHTWIVDEGRQNAR